MGQIWPMARVGPLLTCSPNGPNLAHGKSRPVSGLLTRCAVSSPSSGPLTTRYACDKIKPLLSYGLLTACYHAEPIPIMPDYGPCRPIYPTALGPPILHPCWRLIYRRAVGDPWILRPVYGPWLLWPLTNQGKRRLGKK